MFLNKLFFLLISTFFLSNFLYGYPNISQDIKEKKIYPMGEKIYIKKCKTLVLSRYINYDALVDDLKKSKSCGTLNIKHLEALSLYLWDVKKADSKEFKEIKVLKGEKCQVCGMYLHLYPKWVSEIDYPNNETYKFDGIKDMLKFYFNNKEGILRVLVQDYYTLKTIDAKKAYYVIGSDILGPMGNELIAFANKRKAMDFSFEHKGKYVLSFDELSEKMVRSIE